MIVRPTSEQESQRATAARLSDQILAAVTAVFLDCRSGRGLGVVDLLDDHRDLGDRGRRGMGVGLDRIAWESVWIASMRRVTTSVASDVSRAKSSTSLATTAKPFPASCARTASIVAFSASRTHPLSAPRQGGARRQPRTLAGGRVH